MKVRRMQLVIHVEGEEKPIALEYGAECDIEVQISQTRELLRGFKTFNFGEVAEMCPTGEMSLELHVKAVNQEQKQAADKFSASRFDVQLMRSR